MPKQPVEIWIGGDVHLGDRTALDMTALAADLDGAAGIVNLEGPICEERSKERSGVPGAVELRNGAAAAGALRRAGVRVAGMANNHSADCGSVSTTADALQKAGIAPAALEQHLAKVQINGTLVWVFAENLNHDSGTLLERMHLPLSEGEILIVMFHVTGAPSFLPRPELRNAVDVAVRAGARVVAAHGTHVIGPVERRGDSVIAWGLGNLTFDCDCTKERDGALLRLSMGDDETRARVIPIAAGLAQARVSKASNAPLMMQLFRSVGSTALEESGDF